MTSSIQIKGVLPYNAEIVDRTVALTVMPAEGRPVLVRLERPSRVEAEWCASRLLRGYEVAVQGSGLVAHPNGYLRLLNPNVSL